MSHLLQLVKVASAALQKKETIPLMMEFEVKRTLVLFEKGEALLPMVRRRVRTDVALYGRGGRAVLAAIRRIGYNTLEHRPTIGRWTKLSLLARYLIGL